MISYIFNSTPGQAFAYYYEMIGLVAVLVIASFALKAIYKKRVANKDFVFKKMFKKTPNKLVYFAIGIMFITLLRYENIPYFAMRFWMYMLLLGLLAFIGYQLYKYLKIYPTERDRFESQPRTESKKTQYLPNKK